MNRSGGVGKRPGEDGGDVRTWRTHGEVGDAIAVEITARDSVAPSQLLTAAFETERMAVRRRVIARFGPLTFIAIGR